MLRMEWHAVLLALLAAVWVSEVHGRELSFASPTLEESSKTRYGCPKHPIYNDPWVKDNIAFTYAGATRDGLGGQTTRVMAVYALATAMGVGYVHTPLSCIGHVGGMVHWRNKSCDSVDPKDAATMQRISKFISIPDTVQHSNTNTWHRELFLKGSWNMLANVSATALQLKRPTVIRIEWVHNFLGDCPDLFFHVLSWRPSNADHTEGASVPWLLNAGRSKRIVVHMRRGDLTSIANKRTLPTSFYIRAVKQVIQVLDRTDIDYTVEWFTDMNNSAEEQEDIQRVRSEIPNLSVQINTDLLWNWHQMATADVFVMSKSAYSMVPAVVNPNAVIIRAPSATPCRKACTPSNWIITEDFDGGLSQEALYYIRRKLSGSSGAIVDELVPQ